MEQSIVYDMDMKTSQHDSPGRDVYVLNLIQHKYRDMSAIHKNIASFVLENPEKVVKMSISRLASAAGIRSESSIVRFYKFLGFSGYNDFKLTLATDSAGCAFRNTLQEIGTGDNVQNIMEKLFENIALSFHSSVHDFSLKNLKKASDLIFRANRLIILGYGSFASVASDAVFRFQSIGISCCFSHDSHVNTISLANANENDVLLAISDSGEPDDIVIPAKLANTSTKLISLTDSRLSPLARESDVVLVVDSIEQPFESGGIVSQLLYMGIIHVLCLDISARRMNEPAGYIDF